MLGCAVLLLGCCCLELLSKKLYDRGAERQEDQRSNYTQPQGCIAENQTCLRQTAPTQQRVLSQLSPGHMTTNNPRNEAEWDENETAS